MNLIIYLATFSTNKLLLTFKNNSDIILSIKEIPNWKNLYIIKKHAHLLKNSCGSTNDCLQKNTKVAFN